MKLPTKKQKGQYWHHQEMAPTGFLPDFVSSH